MGGKSKQTQTQTVDPRVMSVGLDNVTRAQTLAGRDYTPYGQSLDLSPATGALNGLLSFKAPDVKTAANVSTDQINHYMDPNLSAVVDATKADMEQNRLVAQNDNAGLVGKMAQWGNGRRGIPVLDINSAFDRNQGTVLGGLRSQAFNNAVGWGLQDLARSLSADTSNQQAAIQSAGVRSGAAGLLGQLLNQQYSAGLDEHRYAQTFPYIGQQAVTSAIGALATPTTTTTTSSGGGGIGGLLSGAGSIMSGLGAMGVGFSDERLKTDVEFLRHDDRGRRWYAYRYVWDEPDTRREGVMAQEVQKTDPHAVHRHESGYLMVDYGALQ